MFKGIWIPTVKTKQIAALYRDITPASTDKSPVTIEVLKKEQDKHKSPMVSVKDEEGTRRVNERIWILKEANNLKFSIAVVAHRGDKEHQACTAKLHTIGESHWWEDIKKDVREFTPSCVHCIILRNGERLPCPLSIALHGERPNEVIHADFLYMRPANNSKLNFVLVIINYSSWYSWLRPRSSAKSEAPTKMWSRWISYYGCMLWLVNDQGSRFRTSLLNSFTKKVRIRQHFTIAYYT